MLALRRLAARLPSGPGVAVARPFTTSAPLLKGSQLPPRPKPPPDDEIEEKFIKGSGPGGQKINKTNSAVQLKHIPTGIVVKSQATRSRSENRHIARKLLAARLDELANGDASRAAAVAERKRKKRAKKLSKSRKKYRALEKEKEAAEKGEEEPDELDQEEDQENGDPGKEDGTGELSQRGEGKPGDGRE
ncbi:hypothetical protein VUR80DRAFT_5843 [Thermomyces stellatus]